MAKRKSKRKSKIDITNDDSLDKYFNMPDDVEKTKTNWWGSGKPPTTKFVLPKAKKDKDICACPKCSQPGYVLYYGHEVCVSHWTRHCENANKYNLKKIFCIYK